MLNFFLKKEKKRTDTKKQDKTNKSIQVAKGLLLYI